MRLKLSGASAIRCALVSASLGTIAGMPVAGYGATEDQGEQLQEIVVSATRRDEGIDKVPISITALNQQAMDDLQIKSVVDLSSIVPGISISPTGAGVPDGADIAIRGIYSNTNAPTTQLYIDETPIAVRQLPAALSNSPFPQIFDLDRVEVLRGPQGTLFGASAMGGAIRFLTPQPDLRSASGFAKADVSYTRGGGPNYEIGGAYGSPIVPDALGFRVSGWYQSSNGYIDREDPYTGVLQERNTNTSDKYVTRPAITWMPTQDLTVTAAFYLQHSHQATSDSYWVTELPNPEPNGHVWGGIPTPYTDDLHVSSLSVKYDLGGGLQLHSDTSYMDRKSIATEDLTSLVEGVLTSPPNPLLPGLESFSWYNYNVATTHAVQQEFRLAHGDPSSRISWLLGVYYRSATQGLSQIEPDLTALTENLAGQTMSEFFGGVPAYQFHGQQLAFYDDFHTTDVSKAGFLDATVKITSKLKLDVGVRVEHLQLQNQDELLGGPFSGLAFAHEVLPDGAWTPVTPRVNLSYEVSDDAMVYASAAKGFRPGGGNLTAYYDGNSLCTQSLNLLGLKAVPPIFNPDSLWSYEIGAKGSLLDRRVSFESSIYYVRWSDIQSTVLVPSCSGSYTTNQGRAISQGADVQLAVLAAEGLKLGMLAGYTNAYYPDAALGTPAVDSNGNPISGTAPLFHPAGGKLPNVVPWTLAANAEYSRSLGAFSAATRMYVRADYRWLDRLTPLPSADPRAYNYDPDVTPYPNPAYGTLALRVGIKTEGWDVSTYVNNIFNADPRLAYGHDNVQGSPLYKAAGIRPLTAGMTAWYRF